MVKLDSLLCYRAESGIQKSHLWLCCSPLVFRALDYTITLYGQPAAYWHGHYHLAREGSPILLWCLRLHPLAFVGAAIGLSLVFSLLILCWPSRPARFLAALMTFGHIYGVGTWVLPSGALGWTALIALLYYCWALMDTTWRKQHQAAQREVMGLRGC